MDRRIYRYLIAVAILNVVQSTFSLRVIGENWRYNAVVHFGPVLIGVVLLAIRRWRYLLRRAAVVKGIGWKAGLCGFFLVQGILFSFLTTGLLARTAMDAVNGSHAKEQPLIDERFAIGNAGMRGWGKGRAGISRSSAPGVGNGWVTSPTSGNWMFPGTASTTTSSCGRALGF